MKSGIELIAAERQEQIEKHNRTVEYDRGANKNNELIHAACGIMSCPGEEVEATAELVWDLGLKDVWDRKIFEKMFKKPYKERLIIAGALIAAEIDRIQNKGNERE